MKYYKNPTTGEVFAYDEDGSQDDYILPELVKMTQAEINAHLSPPILPPSKAELLATITVTTQSGNTFDGNETARNNMLSAIMAAEIIGETESQWKLADNTVETVTLTELKEALTLSIQRVGEIVLSN